MFKFDFPFEDKDFLELQDSINQDINSIKSLLNKFKHNEVSIYFEHNFSNLLNDTYSFKNVYCRLRIQSIHHSSIYIWLSKNHIDTKELSLENLLLFSDITKRFQENFNLFEFQNKFQHFITKANKLNSLKYKNMAKIYNKKFKYITDYFKDNEHLYSKENHRGGTFTDLYFFKNIEHNLVKFSFNHGNTFHIPLFISNKEHTQINNKSLDYSVSHIQISDYYIECIEKNNPFIFSILKNYLFIKIVERKSLENKLTRKAEIAFKDINIDILYDYIKLNKEICNF